MTYDKCKVCGRDKFKSEICCEKIEEKSFEEEFPSLTAYDRKVAPAYTEYDESRVCTVAQIKEHCIDKERVRKHLSFMRTLATCDEATMKIFEKGLDL